MFIFTAKMPRRRVLLSAAVVLFGLLALLLLLRSGKGTAKPGALRAETNEARVAYLASLGWEVDPEPLETLCFTLPAELREPYLSYNDIQRAQGFDLTPCCGKTLTRCTYAVTNHPTYTGPCQADLYLCEDRIVAGDIVCAGERGYLAPLAFPD